MGLKLELSTSPYLSCSKIMFLIKNYSAVVGEGDGKLFISRSTGIWHLSIFLG